MTDERDPPEIPAALRGRFALILALAAPLILTTAIDITLWVTDTWFAERLSSESAAGLASVFWLDYCAVLLMTGVSYAVQANAAQAYGAGRRRGASRAAWSGVAAGVLAIPAFVAIGFTAAPILEWAGIAPGIRRLALAFWWPRFVVAGPLLVVVLSLTSFFNAIDRMLHTLAVTVVICVANVIFCAVLLYGFSAGIAGIGWATVGAEFVGMAVALGLFLGPSIRRQFQPHLTWRRPQVARQFADGVPIGFGNAADQLAFALMQLMCVSLGTIPAALVQILSVLMQIPYAIGIGLARVSTTLVGQSVGRRDPVGARRSATGVLMLMLPVMLALGGLLIAGAPLFAAAMVDPAEPNAAAIVGMSRKTVLAVAVAMFCDSALLAIFNILRGWNDLRVPALVVAATAWLVWVPLCHSLVFPYGSGWVRGLPQFGLGVAGGFWAYSVYAALAALILFVRWNRMQLPADGSRA